MTKQHAGLCDLSWGVMVCQCNEVFQGISGQPLHFVTRFQVVPNYTSLVLMNMDVGSLKYGLSGTTRLARVCLDVP